MPPLRLGSTLSIVAQPQHRPRPLVCSLALKDLVSLLGAGLVSQRVLLLRTCFVAVEVGYLSVHPPPSALLNDPTTGWTDCHLRRIRASHHRSVVYNCFSHRRVLVLSVIANPQHRPLVVSAVAGDQVSSVTGVRAAAQRV